MPGVQLSLQTLVPGKKVNDLVKRYHQQKRAIGKSSS